VKNKLANVFNNLGISPLTGDFELKFLILLEYPISSYEASFKYRQFNSSVFSSLCEIYWISNLPNFFYDIYSRWRLSLGIVFEGIF
jgi:hypothetical protein